VRGADQLPGPPLDEWLVHALRETPRVAVVMGRAVRSELAGPVLALARLRGWGGADEDASALVTTRVLGDVEIADEVARAAATVVAGGLVIELGHAPRLRPWQLWRRLWTRRAPRGAAELRAQAWLGFGLYAVEQWAPVDMPQVLVTCGRRRAIPRA
jgi:hypothetical protein